MIRGSDMYFPKGEAYVVSPLSMVTRLSKKTVQCLLLLNADRKDY